MAEESKHDREEGTHKQQEELGERERERGTVKTRILRIALSFRPYYYSGGIERLT